MPGDEIVFAGVGRRKSDVRLLPLAGDVIAHDPVATGAFTKPAAITDQVKVSGVPITGSNWVKKIFVGAAKADVKATKAMAGNPSARRNCCRYNRDFIRTNSFFVSTYSY